MSRDEAVGEAFVKPTEGDEPLGGDVTDVTRDLDPEDFDFDAFVEGVRPGRRAVRVTMRADLAAELDQILIRAEQLEDGNGPEAQELEAEFEDVKAQIQASQRTFVVEARSEHRARQVIAHAEKTHPRPSKKADEAVIAAWNEEMALHRLADAIIVPSKVTVDGLRTLNERAESEIQKLFGALLDASTNPTKALVTPNFSRRR